jgi:hypothetical protein
MNLEIKPEIDKRLVWHAEKQTHDHAVEGLDVLKALTFDNATQWRTTIDKRLCGAVRILEPIALNYDDVRRFAPHQFEQEFKAQQASPSKREERDALKNLLAAKIRTFATIGDLNLDDEIKRATH